MSPTGWLAFLVAGSVGALLRYVVDLAVADRTEGAFPWGTFTVNVSGSFLSGFVTGLALYHGLSSTPRLVAAVGFCGAFTTFSTFTFETVRLLEEGALAEAVLNVGLTVVTAAGAAALGLLVASR